MALARRPRLSPLPALFESTRPANKDPLADPLYLATRDHPGKRHLREAIERVWQRNGRLLAEPPRQFIQQFRRRFHARAWELYVLQWLRRSRFPLIKSAPHGPDFCIDHPGRGRLWIECVVPQPGEGANRVWQRTTETVWNGPPDDPIKLRYINAIQRKIASISSYRKAKIVGAAEPVLIAMSQGEIRDADLNDVEMPLAFEILFGLGDTVIHEDYRGRRQRVETREQHEILDAGGRPVGSRVFLEPDNSIVSGLLVARAPTLEHFSARRRILILAHNPLATAPVPVGLLPVRGELWRQGTALVHRGVVAEYGKYAVRSRRRPP